MEFSGNGPQESFMVSLADVISRDLTNVGRSTMVLHATSDRWPDTGLAVKVSWPDSGRLPETDFLAKVNDAAQNADGKWATRHLPQVFYSEDIVPGPVSTPESVTRLFDEVRFISREYEYERRTLRIIIQDRLYPLKSLSKVKDIGQVFLDIWCSTFVFFLFRFAIAHTGLVHRWLYDEPGILHCDLSPDKIMYRIAKEADAK